jgi:hypothetical protein
VPGTLCELTRINIRSLQDRVRGQLPDDGRSRLEIATYDETIRFNIALVDDQVASSSLTYRPCVGSTRRPSFCSAGGMIAACSRCSRP